VLLVQSQCDTPALRAPFPRVEVDDFTALQRVQVSAKTGLGLDLMTAALKEAVRDCVYRRPPPPIGAGRLAVPDRLRQLLREDQALPPTQRRHRLLKREEFDLLCAQVGGVSDTEALLKFLHHNGVLFYHKGLFGGRIMLDQNWALEAIYALFDRKKTLSLIRGYGRFTRADLEALIWSAYTPQEQTVFLGMMESCGMCFRVRELPDGDWEYIAPELLPEWSDVQDLLLGRLRDEPTTVEAEAHYAFLHEGVLRGYLSKLGEHAKDAAIYWKYGCWFYKKTTKSQVLIDSEWADAVSQIGSGAIRLRAWGDRARQLIESLIAELQRLPIGQSPEIKRIINAKAVISSSASVVPRLVVNPPSGQSSEPVSESTDAVFLFDGTLEADDKAENTGLNQLQITARPELPPKGTPEIFVSYAWGDDSSEDARKRTEVVERMCEKLDKEGWNFIRDNAALQYGELISGFMKRLSHADYVIVVLNSKYLRSPYCMTELHTIYQYSRQEKEGLLDRIVPLVLDDARLGTPNGRVEHAKYWAARYLKLKSDLDYLGLDDFRLYQNIKKWHSDVGNMLTYVNDVLHPRGFDDIVKADFAALRQMLKRRR
jgi:internalin A